MVNNHDEHTGDDMSPGTQRKSRLPLIQGKPTTIDLLIIEKNYAYFSRIKVMRIT